jgi:hypothetical protein
MVANLLALESDRLQRALRRAAQEILFSLIAAVVALVGAGFLFAALFLYLLEVVNAWQAGLVTGAIILALAGLLVWLAGRTRSRPASPQPAGRPEQPAQGRRGAAAELGEAASAALGQPGLRPVDAAMIALVSGMTLGLRASRRRQEPHGARDDCS